MRNDEALKREGETQKELDLKLDEMEKMKTQIRELTDLKENTEKLLVNRYLN